MGVILMLKLKLFMCVVVFVICNLLMMNFGWVFWLVLVLMMVYKFGVIFWKI